MDDYKPLTDEEITPLVEGMEAGIDNPPSYFWPHVLEQARRANALAEAVRQQGCECHLLGEGHTPDCMTKTHALAAYLGETND